MTELLIYLITSPGDKELLRNKSGSQESGVTRASGCSPLAAEDAAGSQVPGPAPSCRPRLPALWLLPYLIKQDLGSFGQHG